MDKSAFLLCYRNRSMQSTSVFILWVTRHEQNPYHYSICKLNWFMGRTTKSQTSRPSRTELCHLFLWKKNKKELEKESNYFYLHCSLANTCNTKAHLKARCCHFQSKTSLSYTDWRIYMGMKCWPHYNQRVVWIRPLKGYHWWLRYYFSNFSGIKIFLPLKQMIIVCASKK